MKNVEVNLHLIKAAALVASTEETRYYLNGVCLEARNGHITAIATDGHRLVAFEVGRTNDTKESWSHIIPLSILKNLKVLKVKGKNSRLPAILNTTADGKISLEYDRNTITFAPIDGTFPDWRRVIPTECNCEIAQFNVNYLADMKKVADATDADKLGDIVVIGHNGVGPAIVRLPIAIPHVAVIMPMRVKDVSMRDYLASVLDLPFVKGTATTAAAA